MKVKDIMTTNVKACRSDTNLAAAAVIMWENDCGAVPVIDDEGKTVGMITDRDICMATATRRQYASDIAVNQVISGNLYTCNPHDDVKTALKIMQEKKVRRLPVVNEMGMLEGILSMSDIVLQANGTRNKKSKTLSYEDTVNTLKAISERPIN